MDAATKWAWLVKQDWRQRKERWGSRSPDLEVRSKVISDGRTLEASLSISYRRCLQPFEILKTSFSSQRSSFKGLLSSSTELLLFLLAVVLFSSALARSPVELCASPRPCPLPDEAYCRTEVTHGPHGPRKRARYFAADGSELSCNAGEFVLQQSFASLNSTVKNGREMRVCMVLFETFVIKFKDIQL